MKEFQIPVEYITDQTIHDVRYVAKDPDNPTPEELAEIIKYGKSWKWKSTHSIDHPEFTKLREQLGTEGYILIERGWWNGDRVLKSFILNGKVFKKDEPFVCAAAMKYHFKRWTTPNK